jgi:superkiller protein 3
LLLTFLLNSFPTTAQDIPPTQELSLGSSIFVFRVKSSQKRFVSRVSQKPIRSKIQRVATSQKIRKQYNKLTKVVARQERIKPIKPAAAAADVVRKTPEQTAVILAGAGKYYLNENDIDKAVDYFRQANSLDPKNQDIILALSDTLVAKGGSLLENDEAEKAEAYYQEALKSNDRNSAGYAGLGAVYDALEANDKAVANYEKALTLDSELTEVYAPLGILYYQQGEIAKADDFLTKALADNKDDAEAQYFLGLVRYKQNRFPDALAALNASIKADENSAGTHFSLGDTYIKLNRPAEAIAAYKKATELNPKYAEAWFSLGAAYFNQENYADAVTAYQQVVKLQNTNGEAHANLGDAYRLLNRMGEAEGEYRLALYFVKNDAELYSNFGYVLGAQRKWKNAIDALNSAVTLSPDVIDYTNLGWANYNSAQQDFGGKREADARAKLQEAKNALQKAIALNPNFAPAYLNLGITLTDLGEYQASVDTLKRAVELRKNWIFAINELGIAYRKQNDYGNAIQQFEKAVAIDDKFDLAYYNLGEAQYRNKNIKEARKAQEKLRKLNPNLANTLNIIILGMKKS